MKSASTLVYIDDIPTPYRLGVFRLLVTLWPGEVKIFFCARGEPGRVFDLDFSGLDVEFLNGYQYRPLRQVNPFSFKWNPGVLAALEAAKPDVVVLAGYAHPTMIMGARWSRKRGVPYALTCETSALSTTTKGWRWKLRQRIVGPIVRDMAFGLPVGANAAAYLRELGKTDVPMHYFPNTPDTRPYEEAAMLMDEDAAAALRRSYGLNTHGPLFVFVGRLIDAKRPIDAIHAFRTMQGSGEAALLVVGDGPQMGDARQAAAGADNIAFAGWLNDPCQLAKIFAASTALVLPSSHEPWGAVVNEAMASGSTVIATDRVGAAVELIEPDVDGFVVEVADVNAIRRAMEMLAADTGTANAMGVAARQKAMNNGADFAAHNLILGAKNAAARFN